MLMIDTWNHKVVEAALSKETPVEKLPFNIYAASKTEGERAFWEFGRVNEVAFAMNAVLPSATVGTPTTSSNLC
jgi:nucleoside-diphosphate-sugar epimerase